MGRDTIFLYVIAVTAVCFALVNGIQFFVKRNKTAKTVGTIISIKMLNPTTASYRNSKWAEISYHVDGKIYQSQNRIQVPITSQIGTSVMVRYDKLKPEKLYSFSSLRMIAPLFIAGGCVLAGIFKLV